jgi:hypothetical protein
MIALPSVAVCIPTRNQSGVIIDALHSAFVQTIMPCDVVVSDDAGTDDTAAVVDAFRDSLPPVQQALLRYDRSPQQLGIGGNFDRAVRLAQGEFVVKLDSDDVLEPEFVEILSAQLLANPRTGWAHCNVLNIRPDGTPLGLAHTRKRAGTYGAEQALPAYLRHNDTCHCVMIRKSAYLAVGGYRAEMKTAEDWLLWLEMLLNGWGYCFDRRPLARMRKYDGRPELMSKRRMNFVTSIRFMQSHLQPKVYERILNNPNLSPEGAMHIFTSTAARLCVSSGCDEVDPKIRLTLFDAACELNGTLRNRLWRFCGAPLPANVTRFCMRLFGLPRQFARTLIQKMQNVKTSTSRIVSI